MKIKKIIALVLSIIMCLSLIGCQKIIDMDYEREPSIIATDFVTYDTVRKLIEGTDLKLEYIDTSKELSGREENKIKNSLFFIGTNTENIDESLLNGVIILKLEDIITIKENIKDDNILYNDKYADILINNKNEDDDNNGQVIIKPNEGENNNQNDDNGSSQPDDNKDNSSDNNNEQQGNNNQQDDNEDNNSDNKEEKPDEQIILNQDTDKNGKADVNIDYDNDGEADINIDKNNDNIGDINQTNKDINNNGEADLNIDINNDGYPDVNIDLNNDDKPDINVDYNKDGVADTNIDTNSDGIPDKNLNNTDTDDDGKADMNLDLDKDGYPDTNIDTNGDGYPDTNIKILDDEKDKYGYIYYYFKEHVVASFKSVSSKKAPVSRNKDGYKLGTFPVGYNIEYFDELDSRHDEYNAWLFEKIEKMVEGEFARYVVLNNGDNTYTILKDTSITRGRYTVINAEDIEISQAMGQTTVYVDNSLEGILKPIVKKYKISSLDTSKKLLATTIDKSSGYWLDVKNVMKLTETIKNKLCEIKPEYTDIFIKNYDAYMNDLTVLDNKIQSTVNNSLNKVIFIGGKFIYKDLVDSYGLKYVSLYDYSNQQEAPSIDKLRIFAYIIDKYNIKYIIKDQESSASGINSVKSEISHNINTVILESFEDVDDFSKTYLELMTNNYIILKKSIY